jgi:hypothetical protein
MVLHLPISEIPERNDPLTWVGLDITFKTMVISHLAGFSSVGTDGMVCKTPVTPSLQDGIWFW